MNSDYKFNTLPNGKYECKICKKICNTTQSVIAHYWRAHTEQGKSHNSNKGYKEGRTVWNKGLTKETDKRVKQSGETLSEKITNGEIIPSFKNKTHSEETKKKISEKLTVNNKGGRCKWYHVENGYGNIVKVQGTWERDFSKVLNLIDKDWIKPTKNNHSFLWLDADNKEHYYTPDFYCPNLNKYFEVKGYWWGDDKIKMQLVLEQHNNLNIEVIQKAELKAYMKLLK